MTMFLKEAGSSFSESIQPKSFIFFSLADLEKKIRQSKTTGTLNISSQGLANFPTEILRVRGRMVNFQANHNTIPFLPAGFCTSLFALQKVSLQDNRLTHLPHDFAELTNLEVLDLSYNFFISFPESVRVTLLSLFLCAMRCVFESYCFDLVFIYFCCKTISNRVFLPP